MPKEIVLLAMSTFVAAFHEWEMGVWNSKQHAHFPIFSYSMTITVSLLHHDIVTHSSMTNTMTMLAESWKPLIFLHQNH